MLAGEAAAALVLQADTTEQAAARLVGWACTATSARLPVGFADPDAMAGAATGALAHARMPAEAVTVVHMHGMGNPPSDVPELQGILKAMITHSRSSPLCLANHKACFGHSEYASGLVGVVTTCMVTQHQSVPGH